MRVGPSAYTTTKDANVKTGLFYLKACAITGSLDEEKPLIELFPKQAQYTIDDDDEDGDGSRTDTILEYVDDDSRVRHYQNIKAKACGVLGVTYPVQVVGEWNSTDCTSSQDEGVHADYYSFSLASPQEVQISLTWTSYLDPYLYLLEGTGLNGDKVTEDDDTGGNRNAEIVHNLEAETYTVVATTYGELPRVGDYRLQIRSNSHTCDVTPMGSETTFKGTWTLTDCQSTRKLRSYVDYYTFTIPEPTSRSVTIDLESDTDTYLFLISGDDQTGTAFLAENDDRATGDLDSRITSTLEPGTYSIAATTYRGYTGGDYTLTISGHR